MTAPTAGHLHCPSPYETGGVRIGATFLSEEVQVPVEWTTRQGLMVWWSKTHRTRPGTDRCKRHLICESFPTALLVWNSPTPFTLSSGFTMYLFLKKIEVWLIWASLVAQPVKNPPAMQETPVQLLGWEDPLEKRMDTHSNIFAWRIPWTGEPGRLQSMGSQSRTQIRD